MNQSNLNRALKFNPGLHILDRVNDAFDPQSTILSIEVYFTFLDLAYVVIF